MTDEYNTNTGAAKTLIDGAKEKIELAKEEYEIAKKKYDLDLESMKAQLEAAKARNDYQAAGMINSSIAAHVKKGPPVAPVSGPNSKVDNANINYNDVTDNAAQDIYDEANKEAKDSKSLYKYKGTGGATGGSQSSGGGGGNSTPLTPAQKKAAADKAAAEKKAADAKAAADKKAADAKAGVSPFAGLTVAAPTKAAQKKIDAFNDGNFKYNSNHAYGRMAGQIEDLYPDGGGLASVTADRADVKKSIAKFLGNLKTDKDKVNAKKSLDSLLVLKDKYDSYYNSPGSDGKTVSTGDTFKSDGYKQDKKDLIASLPKDLVKVLQNLKDINSTFDQDKISMTKIRAEYVAARDAEGYMNEPIDDKFWDIEKIKKGNPTAYAKIKPLYDSYMAQKRVMDERARFAANGRGIVKNAGYKASDLSFYFEAKKNLLENSGTGNWYNKDANYTKWTGYATGGFVSSKFAQDKFKMGTDTVPAMLTPGEFVMNKFAVQSHGIGKMQAMNNGQSAGDSVYNYSISVNVKSESNPDEIARTVIAQIKSVDAQKMRGVRT